MNENDTRLKHTGGRLPVLLVLSTLLLTTVLILPALAQGTSDAPTGEATPASIGAAVSDPDFSTVDDPLNGDYELFTVDDLIINRTTPLNNDTSSEVDIYLLETNNETISSSSKRTLATVPCYIPAGSPDEYNEVLISQQPQLTRAGRFFVLDFDVIMTLAPTPTNSFTNCDGNGAENIALYVSDLASAANTEIYSLSLTPYNTGIVMADFDRDGFQDLLLMGENEGHSSLELVAVTAVDINDRSQGLTFGPKTEAVGVRAPFSDAMSGDFNADGLIDVAWVSRAYIVEFATVCPGDIAGTVCAGRQALEVVSNPLQSQAQPITTAEPTCNNQVAAGQFGSSQEDSLLVFDCPNTTQVRWYKFNSNFTIAGGGPIDSITFGDSFPDELLTAVGQLDWLGGASDQVVVMNETSLVCGVFQGWSSQAHIGVISFSGNNMNHVFTTGGESECEDLGQPWINGLALGHFAAIADEPNSDGAFNLQIATYLNDGTLRIYTVDPENNDYTPNLVTEINVGTQLGVTPKVNPGEIGETLYYEYGGPNWLVAADLQGRSEYLGPPSVMRLSSHSQPSVILGAPPMHIDYVLPDQTTSVTDDIVNFTAVPSAFQSQYTMSRTGSNQSSDTNKTSYSYTTTEMGGAGFSLKPPYLPNISGKITTTTTDKSETVASNYAFTNNEFEYDASTTTGFGDEIWYSDSSFNLYVYRVLGETVCPADNPDCTEEEEQPLYVMFSGPNSSGTGPASGATTEWYQPVHEPGNIFSYPWSLSQLQQQIGNIDQLSGPQSFFTDGSTQTQSLSWSQGQGTNVSAGTVNNHSHDKGYSLTAGKTIGKLLDVNTSGDINYNDSSAVETLNQSTSSVGASQGIAINKPGNFLNFSLYQYRVEPYLFGHIPDPQTIDQPDLTETIKTYGPLQASFVANPLAPGSGAWWTSSLNPYAENFDVALNHPVRWSEDGSGGGLNCLGSDCLVFNDPLPNNLWSSQFYWMRGLFVTVNSLDGPQRNQATAGDTIYLTARVYNYSLMDMPAGSTIMVRFYRQEINGTVPSGDSVLVGETKLNPLNGFNSDSAPDTPNWTTTSTSFDTTGLDNTNHIFWVLVWAEDGSGNLLSELPGHGLSAKPGTLNGIGDAPLEMVTLDGENRTFSNNVGYLHSKFYIAPANAQALPPLPFADLVLKDVQVTPSEAKPGESVIISANISSQNIAADAIHVQFFPDAAAWQASQNDPSQPVPRAFDVELLPHINAGGTDHLEVPYRAGTCGTQNVLIVARAGGQPDVTVTTATFSAGPCLAYFPVLPVQSPK